MKQSGPNSATPLLIDRFLRQMKCPCCGSIDLSLLYERPYDEPPLSTFLEWRFAFTEPRILSDFPFSLYECAQCELIVQRWVPNDLYAGDASTQMSLLKDSTIQQFEKEQRKLQDGHFLLRRLSVARLGVGILDRSPSQISFLDYGAGWGYSAAMCQAVGMRASCCEVQPEKLAHCQQMNLPTYQPEELPENEFDYVHCDQVLEHLDEPLEALHIMHRSMTEGAILHLAVPQGDKVKDWLSDDSNWTTPKEAEGDLSPIWPFGHINCFHSRNLCELASRAGFTPLEVTRPDRTLWVTSTTTPHVHWKRRLEMPDRHSPTDHFFIKSSTETQL